MKNGSGNGHNGNGNGNGSSLFEFSEDLIIPEEIDEFSNKRTADQLLDDLVIETELFETEGSSDGSTNFFRKRPSRYEHPLWNLGWTDGRMGQPSETNEALLLARGRIRRIKKIQAVNAKLSLNEAKLPDLTARVARVRGLLDNAMSQFTDIIKDRAGRFHEFSYTLGGFYIFVALILFLSDIPLTLKLVAKGFDLKTEHTTASGKLIFGIDDLLTQPSAVVSSLWEPLTLALGVALLGVFTKLFFDEVVFRDSSEKRAKKIVALSIIGLFFLATIVILGFFRSQTQNRMLEDALAKRRVDLTKQLEAQQVPPAEIQALLSGLTAEKESNLEKATFIALTVTLPLVAGVCFSIGWRRIKDTQRYRQLKREITKRERALETASASLHSTLSEIESAKIWLQLNPETPVPDAETQQELSLYRHGYFRGVNVPETIDHGLPLYDRVQRSAHKILAKRLKERMWSDVEVPTS